MKISILDIVCGDVLLNYAVCNIIFCMLKNDIAISFLSKNVHNFILISFLISSYNSHYVHVMLSWVSKLHGLLYPVYKRTCRLTWTSKWSWNIPKTVHGPTHYWSVLEPRSHALWLCKHNTWYSDSNIVISGAHYT